MKKLLLVLSVFYMTIACGTEVVDRRSFIASDSGVRTNESNSESERVEPASSETQVPSEESQQQPEPEESSLPLSTLEWNGVDVIGTNTLGVLSISRGDVK